MHVSVRGLTIWVIYKQAASQKITSKGISHPYKRTHKARLETRCLNRVSVVVVH